MKRFFDLMLGSLVLLALVPLCLLVAFWIKLDSPGPVFFRQERVGRYGRVFRIHKFRTMAIAVPKAADLQLTVGDDPRITRVGRWLRRHRIDELPQLIDVLKGDMSLVGPRPEVPKYVALYPDSLRERVLSVRPGITDPASLAHADENERLARAHDPEREYVDIILPTKLRAAADYADRATWWTDLGVLVRTAGVLLRG